jgi:hypothetical protein
MLFAYPRFNRFYFSFYCLALPMFFLQNAFAQNPVQDLIQKAISSGASEVIIPPGTYPILNGNHFTFRNIKDFTIRAEGVHLIFHTRKTAIVIDKCQNFQIGGWTMDYDPLPFTQGTIIASGPGWSYVDVEIHRGYPMELSSGTRIEVKDKFTRLLKPQVYMIYGTQVETLRPGIMRVYKTEAYAGKVNIGDFLVDHYPNAGGYHGIEITSSRNVTLKDIEFYSSPGYAIHTAGCSGNRFINFKFTLGSLPPGATEARLRTGHADGIHCEYDRIGPYLENCLIENNGDDGIAIHGDMGEFAQDATDSKTITVKSMQELHLEAGDTVVGMTANHGENFEAKVLSFIGNVLSLDHAVTVKQGAFIYNANATGSGFMLKNNVTRNHRARGILVRGSNGIIEGNTVDWTQEAGIALFPEWGTWTQGGFVHKVSILNNTVRRAALMDWTHAVDITVPGDPEAGALQSIEVRGNIIDSCPGLNLALGSIRGVVVIANRFLNAGTSKHGIIDIKQADQVQVRSNCLVGASPLLALKLQNTTNLDADIFQSCATGIFNPSGEGLSSAPLVPVAWGDGTESLFLPSLLFKNHQYDIRGRRF